MNPLPDRFPPVPEHLWTDEQCHFARPLIEGSRGGVAGPFVPLLRSPELMDCAQRLGTYLRYRSAIGTQLSELAILIVARHWSQQVEWAIHAPIAIAAGISSEIVEAISRGERPSAMSQREAAIYDVCSEMVNSKGLSDPVFERALQHFGERGVVDLLGIIGYYTFLSVVMNGARTEAPLSSAEPLPPL